MLEMHVAHTKPLSRMNSLSESHEGSKDTKPIFRNSAKRYIDFARSPKMLNPCLEEIGQVVLFVAYHHNKGSKQL